MSKNFVLPGSGRGRRRPTRFFVGEKFRGGQLTHENNEIFTPRKLHAIQSGLESRLVANSYNYFCKRLAPKHTLNEDIQLFMCNKN